MQTREISEPVGDSTNKAFYPFAPVDTLRQVDLYQKWIQYIRRANGLFVHDSVYVFPIIPATLYNLSFSD